ncbi:reverse transcriptase family protein [Piscinibacter koreensis]|uniref:RNA-directed DNA polymerase n=1 Tax=Piscinibacter koreensis TaxID=2742824 RepID=A0A7Y6TZ57_9BURK|nr:RNA-directed DNA polymerase [Schlegelella koreensis]
MNEPILSLQKLAWRLGVPVNRLRQLADEISRDHREHYNAFALKTGKDKIRQIRPPKEELKAIQRKIVKRVLAPIGLAPTAHGGVPGRSQRSNAELHLGQARVVTVDVKNFFDRVQHRRIYRMFRNEHGFGADVSRLLTRLITLRGSLPQGAPTSPAAANLFLRRAVDEKLGSTLAKLPVTYSRFIDDLTFSGPDPRSLITTVAHLLSECGLTVKKSKVKIAPRHCPQKVTGLLVNSATGGRLTIPRAQREAVRAAIHQLPRLAIRKEWDKQVRSIRGRIAHVERYHPGDGARLRKCLRVALDGQQPKSDAPL